MSIRRSLPALFGLGALAALPAFAQVDSCPHRTISVTVAGRNWAPVLDLKAADFRGEYRGKPVKLLALVPDDRPHRIVIVLDASGSFGPAPASANWALARRIASHLAESSLRETSFALLIFNDKVQERIDFSRPPGAVIERLRQIGADPNYQKMEVKGKTALWDTVLAGLGLLQVPTSGDAFYLITDGGENASRANSAVVRRRLAASGSRVFVTLLVDPSTSHRSRTPEEENGPEEMANVAHATGGAIFGPVIGGSGRMYVAADVDQKISTSDALGNFYQTMVEGFRAEIELPDKVDKWREWKLEFSKEKRQQFKDTQLGYTRDLAPCTE